MAAWNFNDIGSLSAGLIAALKQAIGLGASATNDATPTAASIHSGNAYAQAGPDNRIGADLNLSGGIGSRFFTVVDFSALTGKIVTIVTNGVTVTLTEGVEWTAATSNAATATSLATAIGATAAAVGDMVYITPASTARTLTISTNGDANLTATMGNDGGFVGSLLQGFEQDNETSNFAAGIFGWREGILSGDGDADTHTIAAGTLDLSLAADDSYYVFHDYADTMSYLSTNALAGQFIGTFRIRKITIDTGKIVESVDWRVWATARDPRGDIRSIRRITTSASPSSASPVAFLTSITTGGSAAEEELDFTSGAIWQRARLALGVLTDPGDSVTLSSPGGYSSGYNTVTDITFTAADQELLLEINDVVGGWKILSATPGVVTLDTSVAGLVSAATAGAGARAFVTDALAPTFGAAVVGGGAVTVPVFSTGAAWNVG